MEPEGKLLTIGYVTSCSLSLYSFFLVSSSSSLPSHAYRARLEIELTKAGDTESERLMDHLEELDAATAETKAGRILHGLHRYPGV